MRILFLALSALLLYGSSASAISRNTVMTCAKAFAVHPWTLSTANRTASCSSGYQSPLHEGDYMGLPYDWGGWAKLSDFDKQIEQGYGAGSMPEDGSLSCTTGHDCSGYVSRCWQLTT